MIWIAIGFIVYALLAFSSIILLDDDYDKRTKERAKE